MTATSASRNRLREHRQRLGLTQDEVADALGTLAWDRTHQHVGVDASMISKWERGEKRPRRFYRDLLCVLYEADEYQLALRSNPDQRLKRREPSEEQDLQLTGLAEPPLWIKRILEDASPVTERLQAQGLFISSEELPHPVLELARTRPMGGQGSLAVEAANCDVLSDYLGDMWHALVRADNLLGPRYALGGVLDNIVAVQAAIPLFQDREALRLVDWAAQFAESAAWLYEDLGQLRQGATWIDRAQGWAMQACNQSMMTWTVIGRARQALERRDPGAALPLAEAAEVASRSVSPPMRAAALCYQAESHALLGDEVACQHALDLAERSAGEGGADEWGDAVAGGHGSFCTADYVAAQRGRCWLILGKPDRALPLYLEGIKNRPMVYQRDRGWSLAGLAATHFALGDAEPAATTAWKALQIGINAGSVRTVEETLRVVRQLPLSAQVPETEYVLGASRARD